MGRELKRVALDFKWEIGKIWSGYINPHQRHECVDCDGLGWSKDYKELENEWYGWGKEDYKPNPFREGFRYNASAWNNNLTQEDVNSLIESDRLCDFTRVPLTDEHREIVRKKIEDGGNSWLPFDNGYKPTAKEINEWNLKSMGHDGLNRSIVIKAKLKRQGKSHICIHCDGEGEKWQHPRAKYYYENWKKYDPPKGEGFQLWETTIEGSPSSPVFETLEKLCDWCEDNATTFGKHKATKEEWFKMLDDGFVYHKEGNAVFV